MASTQPSIEINRLEEVEKLGANEYIIAAGPGGKQFYATSGGYSTVAMPVDMLAEVAAGLVKKFVWVSFGSREDSWFFAFETRDGEYNIRIGSATPSAVQQYIAQLSMSKLLRDSLRVQLGDNDSFLAWSRSSWAASGVPRALIDKLRTMSVSTRDWGGVLKGNLKRECWPLHNIQWSRTGSFYFQYQDRHLGRWKAKAMRDAWASLWKDECTKDMRTKIQKELAYVSIDPHAQDGEAFVFFKERQSDELALFVAGFSGGETYSNLGPKDEEQIPENSVQRIAKDAEEPTNLQLAVCRKTGRPHRGESWELAVKRGEVVKVLRDMGRNWFVVQNMKDIKGWVHGTWLDFGQNEVQMDSKSAYAQFQEDLKKLVLPGQLRSFPDMRAYMDACAMVDCQFLKEDPEALGICVHELMALLRGSGLYSKEWLKEGRNLFHPDRFARFCHVEHVEALKPQAEQLFVLYSILMEMA